MAVLDGGLQGGARPQLVGVVADGYGGDEHGGEVVDVRAASEEEPRDVDALHARGELQRGVEVVSGVGVDEVNA
jgi:hypothetical protein